MMKKRLFVLVMAALLCLLAAGCGNGKGGVSDTASKMGEAVSKAGEDLDETISRVVSAVPGDDDASSGTPDDGGTVDSGSDGFLGDDEGSSLPGEGSSSIASGNDSSASGD